MYIYGKNSAREKLKSDGEVMRAYLSPNFRDREILEILRDKKIRTKILPLVALDRKVKGSHQGIILEIEEIPVITLNDFLPEVVAKIERGEKPVVIMLDHLEDPHNLGAIIRTGEALGVDGVIIPKDRSVQVTDTVVKTSVGAINYMPIVLVANLASTIRSLKEKGFWVVGTDMDGEDYTTLDYQMPICLVIGNEGHGMSKIVRDNCDFIARIPMRGQINSLNASVSCGIVLSRIVSTRGS